MNSVYIKVQNLGLPVFSLCQLVPIRKLNDAPPIILPAEQLSVRSSLLVAVLSPKNKYGHTDDYMYVFTVCIS